MAHCLPSTHTFSHISLSDCTLYVHICSIVAKRIVCGRSSGPFQLIDQADGQKVNETKEKVMIDMNDDLTR